MIVVPLLDKDGSEGIYILYLLHYHNNGNTDFRS